MIEIRNIKVVYDEEIITQGTFKAYYGYVVGISGRSGSGKSSLFNIISLLNIDSKIDYWLDGIHVNKLSDSKKMEIRRKRITYLEQDCLFINTLTCIENLILDAKLCGNELSEEDALILLEKVDLRNKAHIYPKKLSGGEEQRLAIAMAMGRDTEIIVCDEITSMLDEENTHKIISILKEEARQKNKIVIISSHEDVVLSLVDFLYSIEKKEIKLVREPIIFELSANSIMDKIKKINNRYMLTIALSRISYRKITFLLLFLVCAITSSFLWFTKAMADEDKLFWENKLEIIAQNELLVYSDNSEQGRLSSYYNYDLLPFEDKEINKKLSEIDGVTSVYPFFGFGLLDTTLPNSNINVNLKVYQNGSLLIDETISPYTGGNSQFNSLFYEVVFPFFEEQHLQDICEKKITENKGVYIDSKIANAIGLKELKEGMTLSTYVYVPCGAFDYNSQTMLMDDNGDMTSYITPTSVPIYQEVEIMIPIVGILPENYTDTALSTSNNLLYLPYEMMLSLYHEAKSMFIPNTNEYVYEPKAYKVYFSSELDKSKLKNEIYKLDENLVIHDGYSNKYAVAESLKENDQFLVGSTRLLLLVSMALVLVYGIHHKQDILHDELYFKNRGVSLFDLKLQVVLECIVLACSISVLSVIFSNLLMTYGFTSEFFLVSRNTVSSSYQTMLLTNLGLSLIFAIFIELPYWMRMRKSK